MLAALAFMAFAVFIVAAYHPQWWIGAVTFITFATFPAFVPKQFLFAGYAVYIHEIPLFLAALYLGITRPPNRNTDLCALGIASITIIGVFNGFWNDCDLRAIGGDSRGLLAVAMSVFIVGRIAWTPLAFVALRAVKITLWISFGLILLGLLDLVKLNVYEFDASIAAKTVHRMTGVERILGPTTQLASAVVVIVIALWVLRPDMSRRTIGYLMPALGILVIGYSRNAIVLLAVTLLVSTLFRRRDTAVGRGHSSRVLRAIWVAIGGIVAFVLLGIFLNMTAGIPGLDTLRVVYTAYSARVLQGFGDIAQQYDYSILYRQGEVVLLKSAIAGHELFGNGFGFRYRPPVGVGFTATAGTYYAHQFYWWAIAKVGWCGLLAYMAAFLTPVAHALFAPGQFALRSAAGSALVGLLVTSVVVPAPEDVSGAPVFGALLGIALLVRAPESAGESDDVAANQAELRSQPNAHLADS